MPPTQKRKDDLQKLCTADGSFFNTRPLVYSSHARCFVPNRALLQHAGIPCCREGPSRKKLPTWLRLKRREKGEVFVHLKHNQLTVSRYFEVAEVPKNRRVPSPGGSRSAPNATATVVASTNPTRFNILFEQFLVFFLGKALLTS